MQGEEGGIVAEKIVGNPGALDKNNDGQDRAGEERVQPEKISLDGLPARSDRDGLEQENTLHGGLAKLGPKLGPGLASC